MSNVIQFPTKSVLTELHDDFIHCFNVIDSQLSQFHDEIGYKTLRNVLMDVNDLGMEDVTGTVSLLVDCRVTLNTFKEQHVPTSDNQQLSCTLYSTRASILGIRTEPNSEDVIIKYEYVSKDTVGEEEDGTRQRLRDFMVSDNERNPDLKWGGYWFISTLVNRLLETKVWLDVKVVSDTNVIVTLENCHIFNINLIGRLENDMLDNYLKETEN